MSELPEHFQRLHARYGAVIDALQAAGAAARDAGPLDERTAHLVQIGAAAAIHSEGAVHSHTRRALEAGCSADEVRHALVLLVPTVGFPTVAAALSWADDVLER